MKLDTTTTNIIIDIANENKIPTGKITKMLNAYFGAVNDSMQNQRAKIIKLDFFGKYIYSTKNRDRFIKNNPEIHQAFLDKGGKVTEFGQLNIK